ncbi:unnamed protein product [Rhizophagus irregularis]|nr:unnamed protein product [Rhizophagus irregularis]
MIYTNYLEPLINQVNHGPFTESEKNYIYEWVSRQNDCDVIRWELLQYEIQKEYGKFRLRNDLKYQWNRKRRQILRQYNTEYFSILHEDDERTPQSNLTEEKINCMDPLVGKVDHDPFSDGEKSYIYEDCDAFRWELLQNEIQKEYVDLTEKIDPPVCKVNHDPFSYSEKSYIYEDCDVIRWKLLQSKIQRKYSKLRKSLKSEKIDSLVNQVNHGLSQMMGKLRL